MLNRVIATAASTVGNTICQNFFPSALPFVEENVTPENCKDFEHKYESGATSITSDPNCTSLLNLEPKISGYLSVLPSPKPIIHVSTVIGNPTLEQLFASELLSRCLLLFNKLKFTQDVEDHRASFVVTADVLTQSEEQTDKVTRGLVVPITLERNNVNAQLVLTEFELDISARTKSYIYESFLGHLEFETATAQRLKLDVRLNVNVGVDGGKLVSFNLAKPMSLSSFADVKVVNAALGYPLATCILEVLEANVVGLNDEMKEETFCLQNLDIRCYPSKSSASGYIWDIHQLNVVFPPHLELPLNECSWKTLNLAVARRQRQSTKEWKPVMTSIQSLEFSNALHPCMLLYTDSDQTEREMHASRTPVSPFSASGYSPSPFSPASTTTSSALSSPASTPFSPVPKSEDGILKFRVRGPVPLEQAYHLFGISQQEINSTFSQHLPLSQTFTMRPRRVRGYLQYNIKTKQFSIMEDVNLIIFEMSKREWHGLPCFHINKSTVSYKQNSKRGNVVFSLSDGEIYLEHNKFHVPLGLTQELLLTKRNRKNAEAIPVQELVEKALLLNPSFSEVPDWYTKNFMLIEASYYWSKKLILTGAILEQPFTKTQKLTKETVQKAVGLTLRFVRIEMDFTLLMAFMEEYYEKENVKSDVVRYTLRMKLPNEYVLYKRRLFDQQQSGAQSLTDIVILVSTQTLFDKQELL